MVQVRAVSRRYIRRMAGFAPCQIFVFDDDKNEVLQEKLFRAAYRNGVSFYNVSYVNYSHKEQDIDEALERMKNAIREL